MLLNEHTHWIENEKQQQQQQRQQLNRSSLNGKYNLLSSCMMSCFSVFIIIGIFLNIRCAYSNTQKFYILCVRRKMVKRNFCSELSFVIIIFATIRSDVYLIDDIIYRIFLDVVYALMFQFINDCMTWQARAVRVNRVWAIFDRTHFIFNGFHLLLVVFFDEAPLCSIFRDRNLIFHRVAAYTLSIVAYSLAFVLGWSARIQNCHNRVSLWVLLSFKKEKESMELKL